LEVSDNGRGLPEDFTPDSTDSFGMVVISSLTKQLGGTLRCENRRDGGASFLISFCGKVKEGLD
jgi:two-component system, sensor histidine kinase PdtaS